MVDARAAADDPVSRHQTLDERGIQHLCGDDGAADGNDASSELRRRCAGISVGGDERTAPTQASAIGAHNHLAALGADGADRRVRDDLDTRCLGPLEQALVIERRVKGTVMGQNRAAVVEVTAHLGVLLTARHHV